MLPSNGTRKLVITTWKVVDTKYLVQANVNNYQVNSQVM